MIDIVSKENPSSKSTTLEALAANSNDSGDNLNPVPLALAQKKSTVTTKKPKATTKKPKATTKKPTKTTKKSKTTKKPKATTKKPEKRTKPKKNRNLSSRFMGIGLLFTFLMSLICLII